MDTLIRIQNKVVANTGCLHFLSVCRLTKQKHSSQLSVRAASVEQKVCIINIQHWGSVFGPEPADPAAGGVAAAAVDHRHLGPAVPPHGAQHGETQLLGISVLVSRGQLKYENKSI